MNLPTTAAEFIEFMEEVWRMDSRPDKSGGVTLRGSPLYERYENALFTARFCGASRTGGSNIDGEHAHVFRFPADGQHAGVKITYDGASCALTSRRYGMKPRGRK